MKIQVTSPQVIMIDSAQARGQNVALLPGETLEFRSAEMVGIASAIVDGEPLEAVGGVYSYTPSEQGVKNIIISWGGTGVLRVKVARLADDALARVRVRKHEASSFQQFKNAARSIYRNVMADGALPADASSVELSGYSHPNSSECVGVRDFA